MWCGVVVARQLDICEDRGETGHVGTISVVFAVYVSSSFTQANRIICRPRLCLQLARDRYPMSTPFWNQSKPQAICTAHICPWTRIIGCHGTNQ